MHHETTVLPDHTHLMLDPEPQLLETQHNPVPVRRTYAWWQRPHLASTTFYRTLLSSYFSDEARTMIWASCVLGCAAAPWQVAPATNPWCDLGHVLNSESGFHGFRTRRQVIDSNSDLARPLADVVQQQRILRAQSGWAPDETTIQRMFRRTGLTALTPAAPAFGRWEAARPNEIWTGDAMHAIRLGGRKTYLFAFIDDHSRAVMAARFGFAEDTIRLAAALRPALGTRGVPEHVYVDNGSAFVDAWLLRACAKLGIKLVHSQPGRPEGDVGNVGSAAQGRGAGRQHRRSEIPQSRDQPRTDRGEAAGRSLRASALERVLPEGRLHLVMGPDRAQHELPSQLPGPEREQRLDTALL